MALDSGFGSWILRIPQPRPDEIIKKFAAKESEFQEALNHYTYRRDGPGTNRGRRHQQGGRRVVPGR